MLDTIKANAGWRLSSGLKKCMNIVLTDKQMTNLRRFGGKTVG